MRRQLAFVLGGGGARGALQVGALRALQEASICPDLLVGTSVGAVNAAHLALHGFTPEGLSGLEATWREAARAGLLPAHYLWLTVRMLFNRLPIRPSSRLRDFFIAHGVKPDLRFRDLRGPELILVAADLNGRCPVLYGLDPEQSVLEGLLASTTLPFWMPPLEVKGRFLVDGGVVSNLPIEPALSRGATEIIALDLNDPRPVDPDTHGFWPFAMRLMGTIEQRQVDLELALAAARRVPVLRIPLRAEEPVAIWDFSRTEELSARGYAIARQELARWQALRWPRWLGRLRRWVPSRTRA